MSKISIDSEGRIHIEDEPELKPQEAAAPPNLDMPAGASGSPGTGNAVSREGARGDSSRFIKGLLVVVAVLAAVFCAVYFGSNSGIGSGSSGVSSRTAVPTASSSTKSKPNAQTLTAEDRIVGDYSNYDSKSIDIEREKASYFLRDFTLPSKLNQLATSSPSELAELLSTFTENDSTSGYCTFTGGEKIRLFVSGYETKHDPWFFTVRVKDVNGNPIYYSNLANIRSASEITDIGFWGDVPIENPTYGEVCEHVAQVFDYERIGLRVSKDNPCIVQGYAIANGIVIDIKAFLKPGSFGLQLVYYPRMHTYEEAKSGIENFPFQDNR